MLEVFGKFLTYGAIGLGLALAILAYRLLSKEQSLAKPRREMFRPIYVFMLFSTVLFLTGFVLEFIKADPGKLAAALKEKAELEQQVAKLNKDQSEAGAELAKARGISGELLRLKLGKLDRLKMMALQKDVDFEYVAEVAEDLRQMDIGLRGAIAMLAPGSPLAASPQQPPPPFVPVHPPAKSP